MNTVELPEDIVEYIISFTCDRRGYNIFNYNNRKKENHIRMARIQMEIYKWKILNVSVQWLKGTKKQIKGWTGKFKKSLSEGKPIISYHTGCYSDVKDEDFYVQQKFQVK
tara:strand:+ start:66 stop:395 length:330 start_codon:yes stop_codon:yes gene_type:complete